MLDAKLVLACLVATAVASAVQKQAVQYTTPRSSFQTTGRVYYTTYRPVVNTTRFRESSKALYTGTPIVYNYGTTPGYYNAGNYSYGYLSTPDYGYGKEIFNKGQPYMPSYGYNNYSNNYSSYNYYDDKKHAGMPVYGGKDNYSGSVYSYTPSYNYGGKDDYNGSAYAYSQLPYTANYAGLPVYKSKDDYNYNNNYNYNSSGPSYPDRPYDGSYTTTSSYYSNNYYDDKYNGYNDKYTTNNYQGWTNDTATWGYWNFNDNNYKNGFNQSALDSYNSYKNDYFLDPNNGSSSQDFFKWPTNTDGYEDKWGAATHPTNFYGNMSGMDWGWSTTGRPDWFFGSGGRHGGRRGGRRHHGRGGRHGGRGGYDSWMRNNSSSSNYGYGGDQTTWSPYGGNYGGYGQTTWNPFGGSYGGYGTAPPQPYGGYGGYGGASSPSYDNYGQRNYSDWFGVGMTTGRWY